MEILFYLYVFDKQLVIDTGGKGVVSWQLIGTALTLAMVEHTFSLFYFGSILSGNWPYLTSLPGIPIWVQDFRLVDLPT
jgi:hypothetical protein